MGVLDFDKVFKNPQYTDTYKAPTNTNSLPDGAFEISTQNPDGSKKYSFDTIYQDRELINVAKDYYENL